MKDRKKWDKRGLLKVGPYLSSSLSAFSLVPKKWVIMLGKLQRGLAN
jgi:hypothetical protein